VTVAEKLDFKLSTRHRCGVLVDNLPCIWAEVLVIEKRKSPVMQCAEPVHGLGGS